VVKAFGVGSIGVPVKRTRQAGVEKKVLKRIYRRLTFKPCTANRRSGLTPERRRVRKTVFRAGVLSAHRLARDDDVVKHEVPG